MSIEKTNRLRIALQKAKAGLEQQDEQKQTESVQNLDDF